MQKQLFGKHGYLWITFLFFMLSLVGHWTFAWMSYVEEATEHGSAIVFENFFQEVMRDTLENWQSEFLQLMWQVAGLAYLLYVGSPQSKEGDERKEEKIDAILELLNPEEAKKIIRKLDLKYPKQ